MHWSKSRHANFERCPRRFFYEYVAAPENQRLADLKARDTPPLVRHKVVKETILGLISAPRASPVPELTALTAAARTILAKASEDEAQIAAHLSIVEPCLATFLERELPDIRNGLVAYHSTGEPVEFSYDGLTMMTSPEVALDHERGIEIRSYRTSAARFRNEHESLLSAGALTVWARTTLKWLDRPIQIADVFLREGGLRYERILSDDEVRRFVASARETAQRYSASAKIKDFPARPDMSGCRFCQFKPVCPEWQEFAEVDYDLEALRQSLAGGGPAKDQTPESRDVFLCHVGKEKDTTVLPLARALEVAHVSYWLAEAEILFGDSIIRKINEGLRTSRYILCFLSDTFVGLGWPEGEMESALSAELSSGEPRVLPVIVGDAAPILKEYPLLSQKKYETWANDPERLVNEIVRVLEREKRGRR